MHVRLHIYFFILCLLIILITVSISSTTSQWSYKNVKELSEHTQGISEAGPQYGPNVNIFALSQCQALWWQWYWQETQSFQHWICIRLRCEMCNNNLLLLYRRGFNKRSGVCKYIRNIAARISDKQIIFFNSDTYHGIHLWILKHIIIKKEQTNYSHKRHIYLIQHCILKKIWCTMQIEKYYNIYMWTILNKIDIFNWGT